MKIKKSLLQAVSFAGVASFGILLNVAHANSAVLGQLLPEASVTLNPGTASHYVVETPTPYISGDIVSTMGGKLARVVGNNGEVVTLSADSQVSVNSVAPLAVTLIEGAFKFSSAAGSATKIATPSGVFRVTSDQTLQGIAIYQNGEFAIKSEQGTFIIESDSDSSVTKIDQQTAYVYANGQSKTVDVLEGGNGIILAILAAAAVIAGIIIAADDNDPTSP